jgi:hypothetical protein
MGFDWKAAIRGVAPALATALGGPAAGAATKALSNVLLGKDNGTEAELEARIASWTPADQLALKKADQDFALEMAKVAEAEDALEGQDRANARAREVGTKDWVTRVLSLAVTAIFTLMCAGLFFVKIPTENRDVLIQVVGTIGSVWGVIIAYYFGTSFGSRSKDETIGKALTNK